MVSEVMAAPIAITDMGTRSLERTSNKMGILLLQVDVVVRFLGGNSISGGSLLGLLLFSALHLLQFGPVQGGIQFGIPLHMFVLAVRLRTQEGLKTGEGRPINNETASAVRPPKGQKAKGQKDERDSHKHSPARGGR